MALTDQRRPIAPTPPTAARPPGTRPPGVRADPLAWRRSVLLGAGMLTSLAGLHVALSGFGWWLASAAFVLLVGGVAAVVRTFARRWWVPTVAAGGAWLVVLTVAYAASESFAFAIPTFETFGRFGEIAAQGWEAIARQGMPATATPGIVFLVVLLAAGCTLVGDLLVQRAPALAVFPFLVLLDIPVVFRTGVADPLWFFATAIVFLLLLRVGRRQTSPTSIVAVGATVLVGSLLIPAVLPDASSVRAPTGDGGGPRGLNPMITLGNDLRRADASLAARYTTDAEAGIYLRLATLDEFNGVNWEPATARADEDRRAETFPAPVGLDPDVPRVTYSASVAVGPVGGRWLPVPYPPETLSGLRGDWYYEPDGFGVRSTNETASGQEYEVTFLDVRPDLGQLGFAEPGPIVDDRFLDVPGDLPDIIADTAESIAGDRESTYEIALALQEYFTDGSFDYSEDAPVEEGYDGSGIGVIAEFLDERSGYCVHFASAMAVMARALEIPSRIAVGFQPGTVETVDGVPTYTVTTHDYHAWPELYFEGVGWLRFEPTPGRGSLPDYSFVDAVDDPETPEIEGPQPTTAPTTAPTTGPDLPEEDLPQTGAGPGEAATDPAPLVLGGMLAVVVLILLSPAIARSVIRFGRVRAIRRGRDSAPAAWAEVRDTARDHGWSAPDTETARDLGERLAAVLVDDHASVERLRGQVESLAYARPAAGVMDVDELAAVRGAIARTSTTKERLRAIFAPPSLLARLNLTRGEDASGEE